jgi:hypothetical protein
VDEYVAAWAAAEHTLEETEAEIKRLAQVRACLSNKRLQGRVFEKLHEKNDEDGNYTNDPLLPVLQLTAAVSAKAQLRVQFRLVVVDTGEACEALTDKVCVL